MLGVVELGNRSELQGNEQIVVVLGHQVMPSGEPAALMKERLDTALSYLSGHPEAAVVVCGGRGKDEPVSAARCMADYLIDAGIPEERIMLEERSANTNQNLRYAAEMLTQAGYDTTDQILVVSSGFHLARVRLLWGRIFGQRYSVSTLAAPVSHIPSRIRMYIREPLALVKSFLLDWR